MNVADTAVTRELPEAATRPLRSFVQRAGRLTPAQQRALDQLWPRFGLEIAQGPLDATASFGRRAPLVLEIGFGNGEALIHGAQHSPERNFIGIEVHKPGVGRALNAIESQALGNVRLYAEDAVEVLKQCIGEGALSEVRIYFPDPWHKKRHNKRRLIQPPLVARLADRLKPGGYIHCATDWQPYAEQMLEVLSAEPLLANTAQGYATQPWYRPLTKFENRGMRLGHGVWDLVFTRR